MPVNELISITLSNNTPMEIGKFLVPEFINEMNITIENLKQLEPLVSRLDDMHKYEKTIYDAYIENNDFYLTDEQLKDAYEIYNKYRR